MDRLYWHKQTIEKPLFPELLWSRPEHKQSSGKLLIIGGNLHGFAAAAEAYNVASRAGIGSVRVLLPDALQKTIGQVFEAGEFAASTKSGSFARPALGAWLDLAQWADGVLLAGDFGRNSETAIVCEQFVEKYTEALTVTKDTVDYFTKTPKNILRRSETTVVLSLAQLQQITQSLRFKRAVTFSMDLLHLVDTLHELSSQYSPNFIVKHLDRIFIASAGQVSSTVLATDLEIWRVATAARATVWWLQNLNRAFDALTTSLMS